MMRALPAAAAALALGACVSLLPEQEPAEFYRLTPPSPASGAAAQDVPTLRIAAPSAARALSGDSILIQRPDGSLAYAAGAQWAAPARNLVQDYLIEAFEAEAGAPIPLRPSDGAPGDYDLTLDLRRFEAVYGGDMESAPVVHVAMAARVMNADRELVAVRSFAASRRASINTMSEIVRAFDAAAGELSGELIAWADEAIAEAERQSD